jgi:hypothetical protein
MVDKLEEEKRRNLQKNEGGNEDQLLIYLPRK